MTASVLLGWPCKRSQTRVQLPASCFATRVVLSQGLRIAKMMVPPLTSPPSVLLGSFGRK
jgi:hypothetical protein